MHRRQKPFSALGLRNFGGFGRRPPPLAAAAAAEEGATRGVTEEVKATGLAEAATAALAARASRSNTRSPYGAGALFSAPLPSLLALLFASLTFLASSSASSLRRLLSASLRIWKESCC